MAGGQYTIRLHGVLDETRIRQQIAAIQKEMGTMAIGGKGKGKGGGAYFADVQKKAKGAGKTVTSYTQGIAKAEKAQKRFGSSTLDITKKVIQFGATTAAIRGVTSGMGDMVRNVYELDGALTEFKKVSDLSGKGLEKYTDQAYKVGKTVARTGTEMVQAATEFKKAGYNEKDSLELGRVASMYQNVADVELTAGEAANFIVSQMKAFNLTASDSEHIIDAVNEVSNNFAVSSADIATNIGKASAALATGNVTYEQSVGLMTAMTEITRNGAKSARGLVSIQSRYNQIIDESSSTGKKLTQWYKDHNIVIKDQNGQLKSFFEVGGEVAKIWDTLSDNEKKYYLNTQAGANQSQNLAALMRNYKTALEATAKAEESSKGKIGSAAKENARYMESMEGKLKNLKSAWEDFSRKMIGSDALKNAIDGLTKFVNFLTTDLGQTLVKTGAGLVAFGGLFKLLGGLTSLVISPFRSANKVFGLFGKTASKTVKPLEKVGKGMKVVKAPTVGAAKAAGKAAIGFTLLGGSFSGLASILTSPAGLIASMLALGAGIMYVNTKINKAKSPEEQYKKTHKKLGQLESKYDEVTDAIDRLHKKQKEGGLTPAESSQLAYLEQEKSQVEDLIETYRELEKAQKTQSSRTPDPKVNKTDKVKQHMRPVTKASPLGAVTKQAQKDAGAYDLLSSKVQIYGDKVVQAGKKQNEMNNLLAKAKKAKASGEYDKAQKYLDKYQKKAEEAQTAQKDINKSFKDMKKTNDELKEFYGSQDKMPKDISESSKAVDQMVKSYDSLVKLNEKGGKKGVDFMGLSGGALDKTITDFKTLGDTIGITVDESGKLNGVNFATFSASLDSMGYTTEEINSALQMLGEQHPEATFEIAGIEVAGKDVDTVLEYLDKADGKDAEATVEINGTEVAVSDIKDVDDLASRLSGEKIEPIVKAKGTQLTWDEFTKLNKGAKVLDALKPIIDLLFNGGEAEEGIATTEKGLKTIDSTDAEASVGVEGGEEAADQTRTVHTSLESIAGQAFEAAVGVTGAEDSADRVVTLRSVIGALAGKVVSVLESGASSSSGRVSALQGAIKALTGKTVQAVARTVGAGAVSGLRGMIAGLHDKTVSIVTKVKKIFTAKGTQNAPGGLAEVNENGFEYIRDAKTGELRVAHGGKRGTTMLGEGDIVYTHGQSLRMRQEQEEELPKYAKGKNLSSKQKKKLKKAKDSYNKNVAKIRGQYDSRIDDLEHQQAMEHLSDSWMGSQMQRAWDAYSKKLKNYNKSESVKKWLKKWKKYGFKTTDGLGKQRKYDKDETKEDARYDVQANRLESEIENLGFSLSDRYLDKNEVQAEEKKLKNLRDKHKLSAEDYDKYMDTIYHNYVDSQMKMYEAGEKTAEDMKAVLKEQAESGKITWNEYYDYIDKIAEKEKEKREKAIEDEINAYDIRAHSIQDSEKYLDESIAKIQQLAKEGKLTAEEESAYIKELKQKYLDQFNTMYTQGKKTYAEMRALIEKYYKDNTLTAEEYYDRLEELASNQLSKEQDALSKRQEQANNENSLARSWIQRKINDLEKQNEEQEKQNELIEKQTDLEKAKVKRVRIYREGVGFVYEQDTEAVKEATKALQEYKKEQEDPEITELKNILAMFDDADELATIKNLENLTGLFADIDFGKFGTNQSMWANWIKENLSTSNGIGLLLNELGNMEDPDKILELLGVTGHISENMVSQYINKSRYASGALRTKAGFARVGEQGYEIALFGAGDSVIPHNLSKNLMEWGQMSPLEYAQAGGVGGDMYNYSFDKLVLPNVHNADDFIRELRNLPNRALQFSGGRA